MKTNSLNIPYLFCLVFLLFTSCSNTKKKIPKKNHENRPDALYYKIQDKTAWMFYKNFTQMELRGEKAQRLLQTIEHHLKEKKKINDSQVMNLYRLAFKLKKDTLLSFKVFDKYDDALQNYRKNQGPRSMRQILLALSARKMLKKNGQFLNGLDLKKNVFSKAFPRQKKSLDLYESFKLKLKYNLLTAKSLHKKKTGGQYIHDELKKNPGWFLLDPSLSFLATNLHFSETGDRIWSSSSLGGFSPLRIKSGGDILRKRLYELSQKIKISLKGQGPCQKIGSFLEKDFCQLDLFMPLYLEFQEIGLDLIYWLIENNKKGQKIEEKVLRTFYSYSENMLRVEKYLHRLQHDNLKNIKKVKIKEIIGEESYLRLLLSASNLTLLHLNYQLMDRLQEEYRKQQNRFNLPDSQYIRMKFVLIKNQKKLKDLSSFFNKGSFSSLPSISKRKKGGGLDKAFYLNIIIETLANKKMKKRGLEFMKETSEYLRLLREKLGMHIFKTRGSSRSYLTPLLNKKRKMFTREIRLGQASISKIGPLDIILGRYENRALNGHLKGFWDDVGVFLGHHDQLIKLGFNEKKNPYFWLKEKIKKNENLLTIINNKAKITSLSSFLRPFRDIMVVRLNPFPLQKDFKKLWTSVHALERKIFKHPIDLLYQGDALPGQLVKKAFPHLKLKRTLHLRTRWIFPEHIALESLPKGKLVPQLISFKGHPIEGKKDQLSLVSSCLLRFYCRNDLFLKLKEGEDILSWLFSKKEIRP
jgi:hypothetical protein